MKKGLLILVICLFIVPIISVRAMQYRELPVSEYVDKMKAGWIGQMVGVGWGGPTEFDHKGMVIPREEIPTWKPEKVNQFQQDDLYVEMTFLRTLEMYGLDASIRQAGIDFANSGYPLWHANQAGRENLRKGIAPPDSGHPNFNSHADDIDYQIEADYAGLISPGMPNSSIRLGEKFGRIMNYGDGLYGGQFVSGMYAEAFFEKDMEKVVRAGLACIPKGSQYYECITDVFKWWKRYPNEWEKAWQLIEDKYNDSADYRRASCGHSRDFNIDAKINGAYIAMGLLYGEGDPDKTIIISTRCGQDSDCNPSSAAGVLFTSLGFSHLPDRFTGALNEQGKFSHTPYSFPILVHVCETLARQAVLKAGGRVERLDNGTEEFFIPVKRPEPSALEQCWEAGPIANSRFSEKELAQIVPPPPVPIIVDSFTICDINEAVEMFAPGWSAKHCGADDDIPPGLHNLGLAGQADWLVTHPQSEEVGCVLFKQIEVPTGKTQLRLTVGHHRQGDWELVVKADEDELLRTTVGSETTVNRTRDIQVDLSQYAGSEILLELINVASGWHYEAAYWGKIAIVTE
jgi:hypothetical protein